LKVNITVFDLKGNLIKTVADKDYSKGIYKINWKLDDNYNKSLASGMYFIRLNAGDYMKTEKIVIKK
jgi:flagellar hook assembly protein FlgD